MKRGLVQKSVVLPHKLTTFKVKVSFVYSLSQEKTTIGFISFCTLFRDGGKLIRFTKKGQHTNALWRGWFHDHYTWLITIHKSHFSTRVFPEPVRALKAKKFLKQNEIDYSHFRTRWSDHSRLRFLLNLIFALNYKALSDQFHHEKLKTGRGQTKTIYFRGSPQLFTSHPHWLRPLHVLKEAPLG